jgi:predicted esterase
MLTYAGQGYATVITDYEGMRDPSRIHHYMVGALEGRAVLDSVRALINHEKAGSVDKDHIFLAGYSQGGHAVLWANQIAETYAPELKLSGIIGFGAVVNVDETLADVTRGSDLDWFGPYVLTSYADYYKESYPLDQILQPPYRIHLVEDVTSHCINTDLAYWGKNPNAVFMPEFVAAMQANTIATIAPQLAMRMQQNNIGPLTSHIPILLNGGTQDDVVLPSQQSNALTAFCHAQSASVHLHEYAGITHYNTMAASLKDVLIWIDTLRSGKAVPSDCSSS